MELEFLRQIKNLAVIAMVSDDYLMEKLILKGGNAIDLIYHLSSRASVDIDFSIETEFTVDEIKLIESKIKKNIEATFESNGFIAFDIRFAERPEKIDESLKTFWGGYKVEFKIIKKETFREKPDDIEFLRRNAQILGTSSIFQIDISKFEYCERKVSEDINGYTVFVYTPEMLVFEKVRAICQQMPEYKRIIPSLTVSARARDFYDIYILMEKFPINISSAENKDLLKKVFEIKRVPLAFLKHIKDYREFHRTGFESLRDTLVPNVAFEDFDYYFDYVLKHFGDIKL